MSDLLRRLREHGGARDVAHAVKSTLMVTVSRTVRRAEPLTPEDEALLAEEADRERGYHLTSKERSKRAHELGEGAPVVRHSVPRLYL